MIGSDCENALGYPAHHKDTTYIADLSLGDILRNNDRVWKIRECYHQATTSVRLLE